MDGTAFPATLKKELTSHSRFMSRTVTHARLALRCQPGALAGQQKSQQVRWNHGCTRQPNRAAPSRGP